MSVGDVFVLDEKQGKTVNRIDTTANWELANPVLALGEFGLEKLSGNFAGKCNLKVGDGVTAWNNLGYLIQVNAVTVCPYDVGDILITMNATHPEQRWPDTKWEVFAPGRVLIGAGTGTDTRGESITFKVGDTGGEYKHQLTTGEMPRHNHNFDRPQWYRRDVFNNDGSIFSQANSTAPHSVKMYVSESGSNHPHNNLPTYIAVYAFRRTL